MEPVFDYLDPEGYFKMKEKDISRQNKEIGLWKEENVADQVSLQLTREPRPLPRMIINPDVKDIFGFKYDDFKLEGYDPHPAIKGQVSV